MSGPPAATAAVRVAVRRALAEVTPGRLVVAAVSGGTDSLALAAALAFECPGSGALVVDHGLQPGSADVAARAAEQCRGLGLDVHVLGPGSPGAPARAAAPATSTTPAPVDHRGSARLSPPGEPRETSVINAGGAGKGVAAGVHGEAAVPGAAVAAVAGVAGVSGVGGPEAQARALRYALLGDAAVRLGAEAVLLGHTLDDQAETVLLGLARGAGARALAGMAAQRGVFHRPLLGLSRETTARACAEAGLEPWEDPHNEDPSYARVRVRTRVLPALERELGPGVAQALARSARQLREDADLLDAMTPALPDEPAVDELAALAPALRSRALKAWAERLVHRAVTAAHVDALRALVDAWHGQGAVALPGGTVVRRTAGHLVPDPVRPATGATPTLQRPDAGEGGGGDG